MKKPLKSTLLNSFDVQKSQKRGISDTTKKTKIKTNLTNQDYLKRTLLLLDIPETQYHKQTKMKIKQDPIFPKNQVAPASSKQFFYIIYFCMTKLISQEQIGELSMWYPPRNVNEQLQFKKTLWKIMQYMENSHRIPKNILVSKNSIMGDSRADQMIQFLRFMAEMALRQQYLNLFSHKHKLIQITQPGYNYPADAPQNQINRFYSYPFVPSTATLDIKLPNISEQDIKNSIKIHQYHIANYTSKLSKLRLNPNLTELQLPYQQILSKLAQQRQLNQGLKEKIPAKILSDNRAFDRRRIIDKNQDIWKILGKHEWIQIQKRESSVIEFEGQIDKMLEKWGTVKGLANITEANSLLEKLENIKKKYKISLQNFNKAKESLIQKLQK